MAVTRRQLLATALGAPFVKNCQFKSRVKGEFVGAGPEVGHRLRRGGSLQLGHSPEQRTKVLVVGAGASGLSAAWQCARAGTGDFLVLDLEAAAGGTSSYSTRGAVPHPWGAHYVPVPLAQNRDLIALLSEMGVLESESPPRGKERFLVRAPEERLFIDGAWQRGLFPYAGAEDVDAQELQRFMRQARQFADYRDGAGKRAFTLPLAFCSDSPELTQLDEMTGAQWLTEHGYHSKRLRWYIEYACRDDYGLTLEQTSAWAMLFYFASRVQSSSQDSAPFLTWPNGNGAIIEHLMARVGTRVQLGKLVTDVRQAPGHVRVTALDVESGRVLTYLAERVILAVPQFVLPRLLPEYRPRAPKHVAAFSYSPWLVANLHLSGRPRHRGVDLAWDSVIYGGQSLGYVEASHQTLRDQGPTVWTYYHPLTGSEPAQARQALLEATHEELSAAVVTELEQAHPDLRRYLERIDIWRWGHAMVRPTPGMIWGGARSQAALPLGRVHFAHSDLSGIALFEEAQFQGIRAAHEVVRELDAGVISL